MYNIIFCLDNNYVPLIKYVLSTFIKFNDPKKYTIHFIMYDPDINKISNMETQIKKQINKISKDFNIVYKHLNPSNEFKELVKNYETKLFKTNEKKKDNSVFGKLANWSRFLIAKSFPDMKTGLYLDLDILFNKNIEGIFKTNISNSIVAVSPYTKGKKKNKIYNIIHKDRVKYLCETYPDIKIDMKKLDNWNYNCGVMYFNFDLFREQEVLKRLKLLLHCIIETKRICKSGTEKIQNLLIPQYETFSVDYNSIIKYSSYNAKNNIIIHFKGEKLHKNISQQYKNIYDNIMKK